MRRWTVPAILGSAAAAAAIVLAVLALPPAEAPQIAPKAEAAPSHERDLPPMPLSLHVPSGFALEAAPVVLLPLAAAPPPRGPSAVAFDLTMPSPSLPRLE
jgi:predicted dienelactone hydrolase